MADKVVREQKILPSQTMGFDAETGVVEAYVSVMGIKDDDDPPDLIPNGAFSKTIQERGPDGANRIRTLWQHDWQEVIGRPIALAEHPRDALPEKILARFPTATGGLYAKTQFVLDVQRGREAVALYKAGAMDEWSIGFDAITATWNKEDEKYYRLLGEIRLWEYSPVTWGANPGTTTTSVKRKEEEGSPQRHGGTEEEGSLSEEKRDQQAGRGAMVKVALLLGLPDGLSEAEVLEEVERRLKAGRGPSGKTLTPREVAQLKARMLEIELNIGAGATGVA